MPYIIGLVVIILLWSFVIKPMLSDAKAFGKTALKTVWVIFSLLVVYSMYEVDGIADAGAVFLVMLVLIPATIKYGPSLVRNTANWCRLQSIKFETRKVQRYLQRNCSLLGEISDKQLAKKIKKECKTKHLVDGKIMQEITDFLYKSSMNVAQALIDTLNDFFKETPMADTHQMYLWNKDIFQNTHYSTKECLQIALGELETSNSVRKIPPVEKSKHQMPEEDAAVLKTIPFELYQTTSQKAIKTMEREEFRIEDL